MYFLFLRSWASQNERAFDRGTVWTAAASTVCDDKSDSREIPRRPDFQGMPSYIISYSLATESDFDRALT